MNEIRYRQAIDQDIPNIIEIWKEFIDFHKNRDPFFSRTEEGPNNFGKFISANLDNDDAIVFVAETSGEVVAYILVTIQNYPPAFETQRYGCINDLAVTKAYRRSGIGEHLYDLGKTWIRKKGINRIEIEIAVTNEVSMSFWEKMDFKPYKKICYLELI